MNYDDIVKNLGGIARIDSSARFGCVLSRLGGCNYPAGTAHRLGLWEMRANLGASDQPEAMSSLASESYQPFRVAFRTQVVFRKRLKQ